MKPIIIDNGWRGGGEEQAQSHGDMRRTREQCRIGSQPLPWSRTVARENPGSISSPGPLRLHTACYTGLERGVCTPPVEEDIREGNVPYTHSQAGVELASSRRAW